MPAAKKSNPTRKQSRPTKSVSKKAEKKTMSRPTFNDVSILPPATQIKLHSNNPRRLAKTPESKARQIAGLKPIKPGECRNPNGRPRRKPFHEAALAIADEVYTKNSLMIKPTDTVASAVAKSLALSATSFGPQKVSAAKELARLWIPVVFQ